MIQCADNLSDTVNIDIPKSNSDKRKVLHVLSEGYSVGGHTRLVKNWIEKDKESEHSLVTTWQIKITSTWLLEEVKASGGWDLSLENIPDFIGRASALRKLAYEWVDIVVVHIHMFDPIPVISFGVEYGPPVLLMNHGEHVFWIENSIIDRLVNFRLSGKELSIRRRNITNNEILPLPLYLPKFSPSEKFSLRKKAGIDNDMVLLLTIASEYKFKSFNSIHFLDILKSIVMNNQNVMAIVIGPENHNEWLVAYEVTNGRILPLGVKQNIDSYYCISDIYIDSYMFVSATSALNGGLYRLPVASLENRYNLPYLLMIFLITDEKKNLVRLMIL